MTLVQFFNLIREIYGPRHEALRLGQHAFNYLYDLYPNVANAIHGDDNLDPFNVDSNLDAMLIFILKNYVEDYK